MDTDKDHGWSNYKITHISLIFCNISMSLLLCYRNYDQNVENQVEEECDLIKIRSHKTHIWVNDYNMSGEQFFMK